MIKIFHEYKMPSLLVYIIIFIVCISSALSSVMASRKKASGKKSSGKKAPVKGSAAGTRQPKGGIVNKSTKWHKHIEHDCSEPGMGTGPGAKPCHKLYGKSVNLLQEHPIDCGNNAIRGFRLKGHPSDKSKFRYDYECHKGINAKPSGNKKTRNFQWMGNAHVLSLHDHNVDCGKMPIARARHGRDGHGTRYNYRCSSTSVKGACRDLHTTWNSNREGMKSLTYHHVQCAEDEVMTQFKLNARNGGRQALKLRGWASHEKRGRYNTNHQYKFRCCKIK